MNRKPLTTLQLSSAQQQRLARSGFLQSFLFLLWREREREREKERARVGVMSVVSLATALSVAKPHAHTHARTRTKKKHAGFETVGDLDGFTVAQLSEGSFFFLVEKRDWSTTNPSMTAWRADRTHGSSLGTLCIIRALH